MANKEVLIIAGPNGAGKTTFAFRYLRLKDQGLPFVNADLIASGLAPVGGRNTDVAAGRLMLAEIDGLAAEGRSFAFETTLAGRGYLRRIDKWRGSGYQVILLFLSLRSPEDAIERVRQRVGQGGHHVPDEAVRRRFDAGIKNLRELYADRVDDWVLFDNNGLVPKVIERGRVPSGH